MVDNSWTNVIGGVTLSVLLQANKNAETQIQSLQRSSKGKQSASINQQITNKRNLIAGNNSKIAANNSKIEWKQKEYDDLMLVDGATRKSAAVSTTTSRAGVLGRLSSMVYGR